MLQRMTSRTALPLLAALATLSSGCATAQHPSGQTFAQGWKNPSQTLIFIGVKGNQQVLYPDSAYLWIGTGVGTREVWWIFVHKQATIRFKNDKNPQAINPNSNGVVPCQALGKATICSQVIDEASLKKGIYRYSVIHAQDENGKPLPDVDPYIEIDR